MVSVPIAANTVMGAPLYRLSVKRDTWQRPSNWIRFLNSSQCIQTCPTRAPLPLPVRSLVSDEILSIAALNSNHHCGSLLEGRHLRG